MLRGLLLAAWFGNSLSCTSSSWNKCQQVMQIAQALGSTQCAYKRDFYDCLRLEGCYFLSNGCQWPSGAAVSCSTLCEAEPGFHTCRDPVVRTTPATDFHLCPHVSKASQSTPPPTAQDFLGSPAIPYTFTVWTDWIRAQSSAVVANVLPSLWLPALRAAFAQIFNLNPLAINIQTPVAHRDYVTYFSSSRPPPAGSEETTFIVVYVHVLNQNDIPATQNMVDTGIILGSPPPNRSSYEAQLRQSLNASLPAGAGLQLQNSWIFVVSGRVASFPIITTTSTTSTTSSYDLFLILQKFRAWRVRCRGGIVYRWEVDELEFWEDKCPGNGGRYKVDPSGRNSTLPINATLRLLTSGSIPDPCCPAINAFDGLARTAFHPGTSWMSSCQSCNPGTAFLGLDGVNNSFRVACVILKQGIDATNQCADIVIEAANDPTSISTTWQLRGVMSGFAVRKELCIPRTNNDYPNLECGVLDNGCRGFIQFGSCPGYKQVCSIYNRCQCTTPAKYSNIRFRYHECGTDSDGCNGTLSFGTCTGWNQSCVNNKCFDTVYRASMWRLACESGTVERWWVKEVEFHLQGLCLAKEGQYKNVISSGAEYSSHSSLKAFDGDLGTFFVTQCLRCAPLEGWIGLDFGRQITIACVRLVQHESTVHQCPRIFLQYSDDGTKWTERARYGFGSYSLQATEKLVFDLDSTKSDADLRPPKRLAQWWRIVCHERLQQRWGIIEFDFYGDRDCKRSLRNGIKTVIALQGSDWPAANAMDHRPQTMWKSACGNSGNPCVPGEAFIGMQFKTLVQVNCVKLHQLELGDGKCEKVRLQFSTSGQDRTWLIRDKFDLKALNMGSFAFLIPYKGVETSSASILIQSLVVLGMLASVSC